MPRNYWTPARIAQFEAMDAKNKAKHKHDEVTAEEQKELCVEEPAALHVQEGRPARDDKSETGRVRTRSSTLGRHPEGREHPTT